MTASSPPDECEADSRLVPGAVFRVIQSPEGHMGLNGFDRTYVEQVDHHLTELLGA